MLLVLYWPEEQHLWPRSSLPEQCMSGVAGKKKKVTPTNPKEFLPTTLRRSYSVATPVEGQCPASIDQHYVGVADYDAEQFHFESLAALLQVKDYLQSFGAFQLRLVSILILVLTLSSLHHQFSCRVSSTLINVSLPDDFSKQGCCFFWTCVFTS